MFTHLYEQFNAYNVQKLVQERDRLEFVLSTYLYLYNNYTYYYYYYYYTTTTTSSYIYKVQGYFYKAHITFPLLLHYLV